MPPRFGVCAAGAVVNPAIAAASSDSARSMLSSPRNFGPVLRPCTSALYFGPAVWSCSFRSARQVLAIFVAVAITHLRANPSSLPMASRVSPQHRRRDALRHDVEAGGSGALHRALQGRPQLAGRDDELAVTAERGRHEIVARRQQLTAVRPLGTIFAQLNLIFGIPRGIVADDGHERQAVAHGRVELCHVPAKRAVTQDSNHG